MEFIVGRNATVSCMSFQETVNMKWLCGGEVLVSKNSTKKLHLSFNPVNDTIHGKIFICTVEILDETDMMKVVQQNFMLTVQGK